MRFTKKQKNIFFFSLFLIIIIGMSASFFTLSPLSPFSFNEENLYITSGDVIRNFNIDSFDGNEVTSGGTVVGLDDRLRIEVGSNWIADTDNINLQYAEQVGDIVYAYYKVTFTNTFNLITNTRLSDSVDIEHNVDPITEHLTAGSYGHYNWLMQPLFGWTSYLDFTHLDLGNVRTYNAENNLFSGNLVMSFDIDTTPLPDTLTDSNGNIATKQFDYIGVSSISVASSTYGLLSNDIPETVGLVPAEYDYTRSTVSGGDTEGSVSGSVYGLWDPDPVLSDAFLSDTFDFGVQYQTVGSSLNPKQKDGSSLYDPRTKEQSMTDCKFTYSLGSLSPLIKEYSRTLTYYQQTLKTQGYLQSLIPFVIGSRVLEDTNTLQSVTRPVALHVTNRYIQASIAITFSVWTSYEVVAIDDETTGLQFPAEYYDDLVFDSTVDGFGGGEFYQEPIVFDWLNEEVLTSIIIIVMVVLILGIVGYLAYRYYIMKRLTGYVNPGMRK